MKNTERRSVSVYKCPFFFFFSSSNSVNGSQTLGDSRLGIELRSRQLEVICRGKIKEVKDNNGEEESVPRLTFLYIRLL